jgi:hypothetical protein
LPRRKAKIKHLQANAPNFKQVIVDDYVWMDDGERIRVVFGTHSAGDSKPGTHSVLFEVEVTLDREDAKDIAATINDWLKKRPRSKRTEDERD